MSVDISGLKKLLLSSYNGYDKAILSFGSSDYDLLLMDEEWRKKEWKYSNDDVLVGDCVLVIGRGKNRKKHFGAKIIEKVNSTLSTVKYCKKSYYLSLGVLAGFL